MVGEVKYVVFQEGSEIDAPDEYPLLAWGLVPFASDAAFVTAKGSVATNGNAYYNTVTHTPRMYQNGSWSDLGSTSPSGVPPLLFNPNGINAPGVSYTDGVDLLDFDNANSQEIWALVKVPDDYVAGRQIKIKGLSYFCNVNSNNVLLKTITTLLESASSILGTYTNTHTSTNTEKTQTVSNRLETVSEIDVSDAAGLINAVAVAPGDMLRIKLYRDNASETVPAAADARVLRYSGVMSFEN